MSEPARARPLLELRSYQLELEVLSPLHVGAGGPPLVGGYDVVADAKLGRYYLIDTERLISERMTAEQIAAGVDPKVENLITRGEWDAYARAVLAGPGGPTIAPLSASTGRFSPSSATPTVGRISPEAASKARCARRSPTPSCATNSA
jgi:hypothetical protein